MSQITYGGDECAKDARESADKRRLPAPDEFAAAILDQCKASEHEYRVEKDQAHEPISYAFLVGSLSCNLKTILQYIEATSPSTYKRLVTDLAFMAEQV